MSEVENLINKVSELTRSNNLVPSEVDHISQVSHMITNMGGNNIIGGQNAQDYRKQGPP